MPCIVAGWKTALGVGWQDMTVITNPYVPGVESATKPAKRIGKSSPPMQGHTTKAHKTNADSTRRVPRC
jgi:hypothetical protein